MKKGGANKIKKKWGRVPVKTVDRRTESKLLEFL